MVLDEPTVTEMGVCPGQETSSPSETRTGPETEVLRWRVLHTKSRQEKALAETLGAMGVSYFLPVACQARYYGRRKVQVELPLFPCYLFLQGTREQAFLADRTKRVARVIEVADQQRLALELAQIRRVLEQGASLEAFPFLRRGVRVEVKDGPWRGLRGMIEDRARRNRLILQVDVLGQATSLEIDGTLLEPIDEVSAAKV